MNVKQKTVDKLFAIRAMKCRVIKMKQEELAEIDTSIMVLNEQIRQQAKQVNNCSQRSEIGNGKIYIVD